MSTCMISPRLRALATVLVAAALACGGGNAADRRAFDQRHAACDGLITNGRTLRQAAQDLGAVLAFRPSVCDSRLAPVPRRVDNCQYPGPVCSAFFEWNAVDAGCTNFGCVYFCEVRTMQSGGPIGGDGLSDAPVCATDWESGQPTF
jgi:hypothetical protein